jgi:hypothetical protein
MDDMNKEAQEYIDFQRLNYPETAEENTSPHEKWDYMDDYEPPKYEGDYDEIYSEYNNSPSPIPESVSIEYLLADGFDELVDDYWGVEDIGDALAAGDIYVEDLDDRKPRRKFVLTEKQLEAQKFYQYVEGKNPENYIPTEEALEWRAKFIADPNFIPF